jgi:tRNA uridine 5-carboxymethylaminomethyl modification enzyme
MGQHFCFIFAYDFVRMLLETYEVIVVGAGHAGNEAAAASANLGCKTLLITMDMTRMGQMSCNPAMGGIAKGQIVREIDALGGYSGIVTDSTMIHFRMLNRSKGPAMWSPRAQNDRMRFAECWRKMLEQLPNLHFWQDMVTELLIKERRVIGVKTGLGITFHAKAVVLAAGTFLNGIIHIGEKQFGGGRIGEKASHGLTEQLKSLGFETGRMKTGTPPRIDGRSLNFSAFEEQKGEEPPQRFSYLDTPLPEKQRSCYITYTNLKVHKILETGFDRSPMFSGRIQGKGPRYCPSIEDKLVRFADRDRHQLFIEPEGWNTVEMYLNGFSTSLPEEVQIKALKAIPGFENVRIFRPGYAIEYDYFPPHQLHHTLETRLIENLFFAGQINGTTGYEEAAAQGIIAGINAALKVKEKEPFILTRDQAYIGVLIDDLINKSVDEPYRMFTSRAEFRLLLRQDNADLRLTPLSYQIGLASEERYQRYKEKKEATELLIKTLEEVSVDPSEVNGWLESIGESPLPQKVKAKKVLLRPKVTLTDLIAHVSALHPFLQYKSEYLIQAEIEIKYEGYFQREQERVEKMRKLESMQLPETLDYTKIPSLSAEAREKLSKIRPKSIGQAARISGVSPADISSLLIYTGR